MGRHLLRLLLVLCVALPAWWAGTTAWADDSPPAAVTLPSPAGWPVRGAPEVTRGFDPPDEPWGAGHRGVDLSASVGDAVLAAADGTITFASMLAGRGVLVVDHGTVRTTYEPVTATVQVGERVRLGQQIGILAAGHCSTGCLHWGLKHGDDYLDPLLLVGGPANANSGGPVRLLPAGAVAQAATRARARAAVAVARVGRGPGGEHGFTLPVDGPITSPFGLRFHPILHVRKLHDGTDLGAPCGTPIRAPADGRVISEYFTEGYGNRLLIDHGLHEGRHVVTAMNHASGYSVGVGGRVRAGQVVGRVGETGYATGCHLHLMVWLDGVLVDPMTWF